MNFIVLNFVIVNICLQVDVVLPEDMSLREAHDIGEELQKKIERIPEVERVEFIFGLLF